MKQIQEISRPPGVDGLVSLLNLIADPDLYREHIKRMEDFRDELNKLINIYGDVKSIEKVKTEANLKLEQARRELVAAKTQAEGIVRAAKDQVAEVEKTKGEVKALKAKLERDRKILQAQIERNATQTEQLQAEAKTLVNSANEARAKYERVREEYAAKLETLQQAAREVA